VARKTLSPRNACSPAARPLCAFDGEQREQLLLPLAEQRFFGVTTRIASLAALGEQLGDHEPGPRWSFPRADLVGEDAAAVGQPCQARTRPPVDLVRVRVDARGGALCSRVPGDARLRAGGGRGSSA